MIGVVRVDLTTGLATATGSSSMGWLGTSEPCKVSDTIFVVAPEPVKKLEVGVLFNKKLSVARF